MIDLQNQYFDNLPRNSISSGRIMIEIFVDKELFRMYTLCAGLLLGKAIVMSIITAKATFSNRVFDTNGDSKDASDTKNSKDEFHVERTKRAHQNDNENIYAFIFISSLYLITVKPRYFIAKCLFIGFTLSRCTQTFAHLYKMHQCRALSYGIGWIINAFMVGNIIYSAI